MRNRAKCKLCGDILESFHRHDYVACKCGEISVDGGSDCYKCSAINWVNFLRIDDEGNEIVPEVIDTQETKVNGPPEENPVVTRAEMIDMLDTMIKNIERLPQNAMTLPINHYDFVSALLLLSSLFKAS